MEESNDIRVSEPRSVASLLDDPEVRAGYEEAHAAREAARVIAWWRDHDRLSGGPITNRVLAGRLAISPQRLTALTRAASGVKAHGFGPSYSMLRRICHATGFAWPEGLVEALKALTPGEHAEVSDPRPDRSRRILDVTIETAEHEIYKGRIVQKS